MPTYSPRYRLCKLRKDAIKRGVIDGSVCPRQVFGNLIGNVDSTSKGGLENVLALSRNSFVRGLILSGVSPALHPRPREIYGDAYAPALIVESQENSIVETNNASRISRPRPLRTSKKCGVCATGRLGRCVRYLTSQIGPALALEELAVRALQPRSTQRKHSLGLRKMPPGRSPLSESILFGDYEKLAYNFKASGMRASRDGAMGVPLSVSLRKTPTQRMQEMTVANSRRLVHVEVRSTVSATHEHAHSIATDSKPGSKERVVSYVQGPVPAGSDEDGRMAAVRNRYPSSRKSQPVVKDKPGFAARKTSRAQQPVSPQSSIPFPSIQSDQLDRVSPVGSGKGWRKLRSMGSALIKKKLGKGTNF